MQHMFFFICSAYFVSGEVLAVITKPFQNQPIYIKNCMKQCCGLHVTSPLVIQPISDSHVRCLHKMNPPRLISIWANIYQPASVTLPLYVTSGRVTDSVAGLDSRWSTPTLFKVQITQKGKSEQ